MKKEGYDNSFGVASAILGMLSVVFASGAGIVLSIVGFVFAQKQKKQHANPWSKAGSILSIVGFILSVISIIALTYFGLASLGNI